MNIAPASSSEATSRAGEVLRARLLAQLGGPGRPRIVTMIAGAGYGKTTLADQWRRQVVAAGGQVARLDRMDGQLAVDRLACKLAALSGDCSGKPSETRTAADRMQVQALLDRIGQQSIQMNLFIDNAHETSTASGLHLLQQIVDHGPANLQLILAGRLAPQLALARQRAAGTVKDLSAHDLAFDTDEARALLAHPSRGSLTRSEARQINHRVEGWPAGLQLLWTGARGSMRSALADHGAAFDLLHAYVQENILSGLSEAQLAFIAKLALVRRFCPALAAAMTDRHDAGQLIDGLKAVHPLLMQRTVDDPQPWFSINGAFAAAVRRVSPLTPAERLATQREAMHWSIANGHLLDALDQSRAGTGTALRLTLGDVPVSMRSFAQLSKVAAHFRHSFPALADLDPKVAAIVAWSFLLTCDLDTAARWTSHLVALNDPALEIQLRALAGGMALSRDRLDEVWQAVGHVDPCTIADPFIRQNLASQVATAMYSRGAFDAADSLIDRLHCQHRDETDEMAIIVRALKVGGFASRGMILAAYRHGQRILEAAERLAGATSVSAAIAAAYVAETLYTLNRPARAREILSDRWRLLRYSPPDPLVRAVLTQVQATACEQGVAAALPLIAEALSWFEARGLARGQASLLQERVRLQLSAADRDGAGRTLASLLQLSAGGEPSQAAGQEIGCLIQIAHARVALADQLPGEALKHLREASGYQGMATRHPYRSVIPMLRAQAYHALHRATDAIAALLPALEAAKAGGAMRPVIDDLGALAPVILDGADIDALPDALVYALQTQYQKNVGLHTEVGADAERLTPREHDIVRLVARAQSNKHIAAELGISPGTVKWNLDNIRRKLGAASRYDIARHYNSKRKITS